MQAAAGEQLLLLVAAAAAAQLLLVGLAVQHAAGLAKCAILCCWMPQYCSQQLALQLGRVAALGKHLLQDHLLLLLPFLCRMGKTKEIAKQRMELQQMLRVQASLEAASAQVAAAGPGHSLACKLVQQEQVQHPAVQRCWHTCVNGKQQQQRHQAGASWALHSHSSSNSAAAQLLQMALAQ
jgi:hypothetical protein